MNAKDLWHYFNKRVSLAKCHELLQTGCIASARIGGKWLTTREHVQDFERRAFEQTDEQKPNLLVTAHSMLFMDKQRTQQYLPLKKR